MRDEMDFRRALMYCLVFGVLVGLIGAVPLLRLPNLCCLWIVAGGFATTYLATRQMRSIEAVDGVIIGAIFGLVYGIVDGLGVFAINAFFNIIGLGLAVRGVKEGGFASLFDIHLAGVAWFLMLFILNVMVGVIFGAVGGLICAAIMAGGQYGGGGTKPQQGKKLRSI